jgi:quercetin dioxygenase-like cupin family protein
MPASVLALAASASFTGGASATTTLEDSVGRLSIAVLRIESLPWNRISNDFVGDDHGVSVTVLVVDAAPGGGPALHRHPYDEVIVVLEGESTLDDGVDTRVVGPGDIVVIPAGQPHGFTNTGDSPLRQIDIHASPRFVTDWLEQAAD